LRETGNISLYQRHGKTTDNCNNNTSARIYTACPAPSLSHSPIATMVHCKIALGGALRRFSVADGETDGTHAPPLTLAALRAALATLDASAAAPGSLSFLDSDGDACALLSDADLREALAVSPVLLRLRFEPAPAGRGRQGARDCSERWWWWWGGRGPRQGAWPPTAAVQGGCAAGRGREGLS
jgi:hypothetical protein